MGVGGLEDGVGWEGGVGCPRRASCWHGEGLGGVCVSVCVENNFQVWRTDIKPRNEDFLVFPFYHFLCAATGTLIMGFSSTFWE